MLEVEMIATKHGTDVAMMCVQLPNMAHHHRCQVILAVKCCGKRVITCVCFENVLHRDSNLATLRWNVLNLGQNWVNSMFISE